MARNIRMRSVEPPRILEWFWLKNDKGCFARNIFDGSVEFVIEKKFEGHFVLYIQSTGEKHEYGCTDETEVMIIAERIFESE